MFAEMNGNSVDYSNEGGEYIILSILHWKTPSVERREILFPGGVLI